MGVHGDPFSQRRREGPGWGGRRASPTQRRGQQQAGRQAGGSVHDRTRAKTLALQGGWGRPYDRRKFRSGRVDTKKEIHILRIATSCRQNHTILLHVGERTRRHPLYSIQQPKGAVFPPTHRYVTPDKIAAPHLARSSSSSCSSISCLSCPRVDAPLSPSLPLPALS